MTTSFNRAPGPRYIRLDSKSYKLEFPVPCRHEDEQRQKLIEQVVNVSSKVLGEKTSSLTLGATWKITGEVLGKLLTGHKHVHAIELWNYQGISDEDVEHLRPLESLSQIELINCATKVSDKIRTCLTSVSVIQNRAIIDLLND